MKKIIGVKAFEKGMKCKDMQYAENSEFTHNGEIEICRSGLHYCENPLDVLNYYDLCNSDFAEVVEHGEEKQTHSEDSKVCTNRIKIGAKLDLKAFIKVSFDFLWEKCKDIDSGNYSNQASSGNYSQQASSGYNSKHEATGNNSVIAAIGINSIIKAKKGCWITLAEYDSNGIILYVKSAKIDGKKLKADTWYKLEGKKFIETLN